MPNALWNPVTLLASLVVLLSFAPAVLAAGETLKQPSQPVVWSGTVAGGDGPTTEIPDCAPGCERFDLTVDLPGGVWTNKPGGLQVAIRWSGHTLGDNLRLYVYRDGGLVAKSDGIIAIAQSVLIPEAPGGVYTVYVAYDPDSPSASVSYQGLAEVEYATKPNPARALLPDLEVRPQQNLSFDPGGIFFDAVSPDHPSCYQSEVDEEDARLCLRFDQIFANTGEGRMELHFSIPTGETPPRADAYQRVFTSQGSSADVLVGQVEFHAVHGHYHFLSFGVSSLWRVDASGRKVGVEPVRSRRTKRAAGGTLVRNGRKVSFCMADIYIDAWAQKGDGPRTYNAPECLFPASSDGATDFYVQGISNGWSDIYDWYLPDQYIEVTGVPDGDYVLETIADPDQRLVEADRSNNCGGVRIRLSNMATATPSVELLGPASSCNSGG